MTHDEILIVRNMPNEYANEPHGVTICYRNNKVIVASRVLPPIICQFGVWDWREIKITAAEEPGQ